jgi:hypothetical protein
VINLERTLKPLTVLTKDQVRSKYVRVHYADYILMIPRAIAADVYDLANGQTISKRTLVDLRLAMGLNPKVTE